MDDEHQYVRCPLSVFTTDLYTEFIKQQNDSSLSNLLISPVSIWIALSMIEAGCGGDTRREMISGLRMPGQLQEDKLHKIISNKLMRCFGNDFGVQISFANRLFILKSASIEEKFRKLLQMCYKSDVGELGGLDALFAKQSRINAWVNDNTHRKIRELVPADMVNDDTSLMLINAVYFRGRWQEVFDEEETYDGIFHKLDGSPAIVRMMKGVEYYPFARLDRLNADVVKVPFKQSSWEMLFILPDEISGLPTLLSHLQKPHAIDSILRRKFMLRNIELHIPRFRLNTDPALNLRKILQSLGIRLLFEQERADLGGISEQTPLFLSAIFHNALIEVDERGTRAAVDTATAIDSHEETKCLRMDHAFLIAILYGKSIPVFIGHVVNPQNSVC
ncbi:unnamed protein product [Calicophoron daubneyi]|uniref:Serpin domain-containing protein n=1 Tax=Calicophoron daubneyi TaxID=300641 RepID=A0AAV2TXM9_CALDB